MPKDTYFNLPEEKRQNLLEVIIDEFAEHDYKSASVSKICEKAGIAKGSFYQYFNHKKDMYAYLIRQIGERKMTTFAKYQDQLDMKDTFDYLRMLYVIGIDFTINHPKLYRIAKHYMNLPESFQMELLGDQAEKNDAYLADLFKRGIEQGVLREDLNIDLTIRMLTEMSTSISEYYLFRLGLEDVEKDTFMALANEMINILENGIRKR